MSAHGRLLAAAIAAVTLLTMTGSSADPSAGASADQFLVRELWGYGDATGTAGSTIRVYAAELSDASMGSSALPKGLTPSVTSRELVGFISLSTPGSTSRSASASSVEFVMDPSMSITTVRLAGTGLCPGDTPWSAEITMVATASAPVVVGYGDDDDFFLAPEPLHASADRWRFGGVVRSATPDVRLTTPCDGLVASFNDRAGSYVATLAQVEAHASATG